MSQSTVDRAHLRKAIKSALSYLEPKPLGFDLIKAFLNESRFFACISSSITSVIQVTAVVS